MSGHTPGPWLYRPQEFDDWGTVRASPDEQGRMWPICQARNPAVRHDDYGRFRENGTDPFEANARLIAAAPELLEVARMVVGASDLAGFSGPLGDAARAAIAKATGTPA